MTREEKEQKLLELIPIFEEIYKNAHFIINAYNKIPIQDLTQYEGPDDEVIPFHIKEAIKNLSVFEHQDFIKKDALYIKSSNFGLLYADGKFANICDSNGNIIKEMDDNILELNEARKFLWSE